ncbi:RNA lariat debranching enzyme [Aureococcus anophagefferens]|nr:RNA lariat debranching enzyme [Aureococcus anophagefferens]
MAAMDESLLQLRAVWQKDLFENVVPFWLDHSLDTEYGGYFSALDEHGEVYDDTKYMWLNGRALYAKDDQGLLFFSLSRDGSERLHLQRKPYAAVFYVQGKLSYWRMLKVIEDEGGSHGEDAAAVLASAEAMFETLLEWIEDPSKCGRPPAAPSHTTKLADVMCAASLSLDFYHLSADAETREGHKRRIAQACADVLRHYDASKRILVEQAGPDGVDYATPAGRLFLPGHSIEVAWFLLQMVEVVPDETLKNVALDAIEGSLERGWDDAHGGGLLYMMDLEGRPLVDATVTNDDKRGGVHGALIALVMAHAHGRRRPLGLAPQGPRLLLRPLRHHGLRRLKLRRHARHTAKGGNYMGFFHLPRALIMCVKMTGPRYHL